MPETVERRVEAVAADAEDLADVGDAATDTRLPTRFQLFLLLHFFRTNQSCNFNMFQLQPVGCSIVEWTFILTIVFIYFIYFYVYYYYHLCFVIRYRIIFPLLVRPARR